MILTKVQQMEMIKKMKVKLQSREIIELFERKKSEKLYDLKQLKENNEALFLQKIYTFQVVNGVSLWEVNRKLKRLIKTGLTEEQIQSGKVTITLSNKKFNTLATQTEIATIEKMIDELEGFEELRLSFFYNYKPNYKEKKIFGVVSRWLEIQFD
jgi:hypothetical protein